MKRYLQCTVPRVEIRSVVLSNLKKPWTENAAFRTKDFEYRFYLYRIGQRVVITTCYKMWSEIRAHDIRAPVLTAVGRMEALWSVLSHFYHLNT